MLNNTSTLRQNRRWLIPMLLLVVGLVGLVTVLLLTDRWPGGGAEVSLAAMPTESVVVLHFDRETADLPRLTTLWNTFATATADFEPPLDTPFQTLPQQLQELDMTLAADVLPWLGPTVSLSLLSLADERTTAEWVIAADSVDEAAADGFVAKVEAGAWTAVRSDNLVFVGSSETAVQQAMAAQFGDSIAEDANYQEAIATLPADYPITLYVMGSEVRPIVERVWAGTAVSTTLPLPQLLNPNGLRSLAIAFTTTAMGVQMDSSTLYDLAQLSATEQAALALWLAEPQTDSIAPENTLVYLTGIGFNLLWDRYLESLAANPAQADSIEAIQLLGDQFGLNPNSDLFPLLDGETAVILAPSRSGTAAQSLRLNLGGTLLAGTSDPDSLAANLAGFTTAISEPQLGLATVQATAVNDIPLTQLETSLLPGLSLVYGVGHDYLLLSTSAESVGELNFGNGRSLADNPDFQMALAMMPENKKPALFVNVTELVEVFGSSGFMLAQARGFARATAVLRPIHTLAASSSVSENRVQHRIVLFIVTE